MAATVPDHYSTEFTSNWLAALGQSRCRLDDYIEHESCQGERKSFNKLAQVNSTKLVARLGNTRWDEIDDSLRWAYHDPYDVVNPLDEWDETMLGQVTLPQSQYVREHERAYFRDCDDVAWAAAIGNAKTGKLGTTDVALPAGQKIAAGGTGMTLTKLNTVLDIMDTADALDDESAMQRVFVWTVKQRSQLLNTTEVKSSDYNTVKALAEGKIDSFMGFKFKIVKRLPLVGGVRTNIAWMRGAIKQIRFPKGTRISIRDDKNEAIQIRSKWRLGAVRIYDEGVVQCDCTEV